MVVEKKELEATWFSTSIASRFFAAACMSYVAFCSRSWV